MAAMPDPVTDFVFSFEQLIDQIHSIFNTSRYAKGDEYARMSALKNYIWEQSKIFNEECIFLSVPIISSIERTKASTILERRGFYALWYSGDPLKFDT